MGPVRGGPEAPEARMDYRADVPVWKAGHVGQGWRLLGKTKGHGWPHLGRPPELQGAHSWASLSRVTKSWGA